VLLETTDPDDSPLLHDVTFGPDLAGVSSDAGPVENTGFRAAPNPFRSEVAVSFALPVAGQVRLEIFDVNGRQVRGFGGSYMAAGTHGLSWDGTDDDGIRMAPGLYWICLDLSGKKQTRGVVLLR
jgi:hypothetical protein